MSLTLETMEWTLLEYGIGLDIEPSIKNVVPIILNQLIYNNMHRRFIEFNDTTHRVLLTNEGRQWAENNCRTRAGLLG